MVASPQNEFSENSLPKAVGSETRGSELGHGHRKIIPSTRLNNSDYTDVPNLGSFGIRGQKHSGAIIKMSQQTLPMEKVK